MTDTVICRIIKTSRLKEGFNDDTGTKRLNQVQQWLTRRIIKKSRLKEGFNDDDDNAEDDDTTTNAATDTVIVLLLPKLLLYQQLVFKASTHDHVQNRRQALHWLPV